MESPLNMKIGNDCSYIVEQKLAQKYDELYVHIKLANGSMGGNFCQLIQWDYHSKRWIVYEYDDENTWGIGKMTFATIKGTISYLLFTQITGGISKKSFGKYSHLSVNLPMPEKMDGNGHIIELQCIENESETNMIKKLEQYLTWALNIISEVVCVQRGFEGDVQYIESLNLQ